MIKIKLGESVKRFDLLKTNDEGLAIKKDKLKFSDMYKFLAAEDGKKGDVIEMLLFKRY